MKQKPKIHISAYCYHKELKKICDKLWSDIIKAKAGYKSEISGKTERLHAHHLLGKPNYRLRYEILNGVCCTAGEHFYGFHVAGRRQQYEDMIFKKRRKGQREYLENLKWQSGKTNLNDVYLYLRAELKKYTKHEKPSLPLGRV